MFDTLSTLNASTVLAGLNKSHGKVLRRYWQIHKRVFDSTPVCQKTARLLTAIAGVPTDPEWVVIVDDAIATGLLVPHV